MRFELVIDTTDSDDLSKGKLRLVKDDYIYIDANDFPSDVECIVVSCKKVKTLEEK